MPASCSEGQRMPVLETVPVGPHGFQPAPEAPDRRTGGFDNDDFTHQNTFTAECGIFTPWSS